MDLSQPAGAAPCLLIQLEYMVRILLGIVAVVALGALLFVMYPMTRSTSIAQVALPIAVAEELPLTLAPDYAQSTRDRFIAEKQAFIEADLSAMEIRLWENGEVVFESAIKTKGREGSWWETPAGVYKVTLKKENHFSSFGHVYQPWSIAFQGNFFIHGWPYYEDGTDVSSAYSGGCIRLETPDAERLYPLVSTGTPVVVIKDEVRDIFAYDDAPKLPEVLAKHVLVADIGSGAIIMGKDIETPFAMGDIKNMLIALVASEYVNLDSLLSVSPLAVDDPAAKSVTSGERVRAYDLLFPLLGEGSQGAADTFTDRLGQERMQQLVLNKSKSIGMLKTSPEETTATDAATLLAHLSLNRPFVLTLSVGSLEGSAYGEPVFARATGTASLPNSALTVRGGIKDDKVYAAIVNITVRGERRRIAVVVANSPTLTGDVNRIIEVIEAYAERSSGN